MNGDDSGKLSCLVDEMENLKDKYNDNEQRAENEEEEAASASAKKNWMRNRQKKIWKQMKW